MTSIGIQQDGWAKNQCWSSWRTRFSTFCYNNIDYDSSFCGPFAFSALFILLPTAHCPWELDEQLLRGQATQPLQFTSWLNGNPVVKKFSCTVNRKYCLRFFSIIWRLPIISCVMEKQDTFSILFIAIILTLRLLFFFFFLTKETKCQLQQQFSTWKIVTKFVCIWVCRP